MCVMSRSTEYLGVFPCVGVCGYPVRTECGNAWGSQDLQTHFLQRKNTRFLFLSLFFILQVRVAGPRDAVGAYFTADEIPRGRTGTFERRRGPASTEPSAPSARSPAPLGLNRTDERERERERLESRRSRDETFRRCCSVDIQTVVQGATLVIKIQGEGDRQSQREAF